MVFVKNIDNNEVEVVTVSRGHVYVDIMNHDEFVEVYLYEPYYLVGRTSYVKIN